MQSINRRENKKTLVEDCLNQIKLHPVILNDYVSHVLPSKSTLNLLDSDLIWLDEEKETFDGLKPSISEDNECRETSKPDSFNSKGTMVFKKNRWSHKNQIKLVSASGPDSNVYTREHFKWLLSDKRLSDVNILKTNEISFDDFVNKRFFCLENYFGKNTRLTNKLAEFCEWAKSEFNCSEHELDPITLMKIFSVNYESEPLMFMKINLEEIKDNDLVEKLMPSNMNLLKQMSKKSEVRYMKKSIWTKLKRKPQFTQSDIKLSSKFAKFESVRLFSDFFKAKRNQRLPYSFREANLPKI